MSIQKTLDDNISEERRAYQYLNAQKLVDIRLHPSLFTQTGGMSEKERKAYLCQHVNNLNNRRSIYGLQPISINKHEQNKNHISDNLLTNNSQ